MAIRYFCDICDKEVQNSQGRRALRKGRISVEIIHAVDEAWDQGHVCDDCIKDAVVNGEPLK